MNRDATDTAKRKRTAIRLAFAAGFRPSNFAVFKTFAFAGFFAYAWYSLGTSPECAAAAAVSAALGLAVYTIL